MATTTKFVTPYNYKLTKENMEKESKKPSLTVVGQTYTIRELVERASLGYYPASTKEGIWAPEEDIDSQDLEKFQNLDLSEKHEILQQTRENVLHLAEAMEETKKKISDLRTKVAAQQEEYLLEKLAQRKQTPTKKTTPKE